MNKFLYKISTKLKGEIKDPEGEVVEKISSRVGIAQNIKVKKGKFYEIFIEAPSKKDADEKIKALAEEILINPVVETYSLEYFEEISCQN